MYPQEKYNFLVKPPIVVFAGLAWYLLCLVATAIKALEDKYYGAYVFLGKSVGAIIELLQILF